MVFTDGQPADITAVTRTLDAREWRCPLPLLKARKALQELSAGQWLEVQVSDPASKKDFFTFAEQTGQRIEFREQPSGDYLFWLERRGE